MLVLLLLLLLEGMIEFCSRPLHVLRAKSVRRLLHVSFCGRISAVWHIIIAVF